MISPIVAVRLVTRLWATRFGRYPSRSIAAWTRSRVSGAICSCRPLSTLETVVIETPASPATDRMVTRRLSITFCNALLKRISSLRPGHRLVKTRCRDVTVQTAPTRDGRSPCTSPSVRRTGAGPVSVTARKPRQSEQLRRDRTTVEGRDARYAVTAGESRRTRGDPNKPRAGAIAPALTLPSVDVDAPRLSQQSNRRSTAGSDRALS